MSLDNAWLCLDCQLAMPAFCAIRHLEQPGMNHTVVRVA